MKRTPAEIVEFLKSKGLSENFCPIPFSSTLFEADGKVCLCRQKGNEFAVGDATKQSFEEIWNGPLIKGIRQEFLTGNIKTCASEISRDHCNLSTDREYLLDIIDYKVHQDRLPVQITPNFNGKCNLECPMCHVWQQPNGLYDQIHLWEKLEHEFIPHLVAIDSFSGEPFIQKDTFRLIDLCSRINPSILWSFTTNGNWKLNTHLKSYLDKIAIKNIYFSIDSLNSESYGKIRKKGNLEKALQAVDDMQEYEKERLASGKSALGLGLNFTMQRENWKELPDIIRYIRRKNIRISIRCLVEPFQFSLMTLENSDKIEILNYYKETLRLEEWPMAVRAISPLLETLPRIDKTDFLIHYSEQLSNFKSKLLT